MTVNALAIFEPIQAQMEQAKIENEKLIFDYDDPKGDREARSHIFGLRKIKTRINEAHKAGKGEFLAACREIDGFKNQLIADVDGMIAVHDEPLKLIEKERAEILAEKRRVEAAAEAAKQARQKEELAASIERARMAEVAAQAAKNEAAAAIKAAKDEAAEAVRAAETQVAEVIRAANAQAKARQEEAWRIERDRKIAEQAQAKAEIDKEQALVNAENKRLADIEAVEAKAVAEAQAKELAARRRVDAEVAEKKRLQAIEDKRITDQKHRLEVVQSITDRLKELIEEDFVTGRVMAALLACTIPHVKIVY